MEKIKVNMSPNPLDVQTIHASQNDGEARQWEFELHNNGELIDASNVTEQLFFKAYKGGTEQLLPENGSTPTTSPFIGDIRYPQGLLTDQEFTYRQSPTEEDGLAKITDIKGNTLVWNQLVQNGNFVDTSLWRTYASTGFSVSNNVGSFTVTGASGAIYQTNTPTYVNGHKYLVIADFYVSQQSNINVEVSGTRGKTETVNANTWYRYSDTVTPSAQGNLSLTCGQASVQVRNVMCFDLTQMGLDITDPSEFTSLFSLSYYSYNQGSLLSFNGNGIKTVGKNRLNNDNQLWGTYGTSSTGYISSVNRLAPYLFEIEFAKGQTYTVSYLDDGVLDSGDYLFVGVNQYANGVRIADSSWQRMPYSFTVNEQTDTVRFTFRKSNDDASCEDLVPNIGDKLLFQLEEGSTATDYEPYTNTTSIPTSTYFPTGMKSAGTVYDELTPTKAITRIGSRAYQSGDESDTSVITDGTTTYYALATPTETSFTTASLVTENAEIPLSNNDGVLIGKCTEELSENPGFIDAKIKLADADGECYSNKLQLHVERSPQ